MKQTRFSRKSNEVIPCNLKDLKDQERMEQYQSFTSRLHQILQVLNTEKQALLLKVASEKEQLMKTIYNHQCSIEKLKTDNELLREENFQLRSELEQKRVVIEYLKKKSRKTELENNSLSSILQYLEAKNKELSSELFTIAQGNTNRQQLKTQIKTSKKRGCVIDRESLLEYTDFDQKDIKPLQLIKVSSYPISTVLKGLHEESQRNTVQKGKAKDDQKVFCELQRVRSVGVIAKTGRQPTARNQVTASRKRNSITKSFISQLIEQQRSKKAKIKSHGNDTSTKNSEKINS